MIIVLGLEGDMNTGFSSSQPSATHARSGRLATMLHANRKRDLRERRLCDLDFAKRRATRRRRRRQSVSRDGMRIISYVLIIPTFVVLFTGMTVCLCAVSASIGKNTVFWKERRRYRVVGPFILAIGCLLAISTYILFKWSRTGGHRFQGGPLNSSCHVSSSDDVLHNMVTEWSPGSSSYRGQMRRLTEGEEEMTSEGEFIHLEEFREESPTREQEYLTTRSILSSRPRERSQFITNRQQAVNDNGHARTWRQHARNEQTVTAMPRITCTEDRSRSITYEMALPFKPSTTRKEDRTQISRYLATTGYNNRIPLSLSTNCGTW